MKNIVLKFKNKIKKNNNIDSNLNKRTFERKEVLLLLFVTSIICVIIGYLLGGNFIKNKKAESHDEYLTKFIKNYEFIISNYYEEIDKQSLINDAISGMMNSLEDPYSMYMDSSSSSNFNITLDGSYEGLGIQIMKDENSGHMLITGIFESSTAKEAGLKVGDFITALNGESLKDKTSSEFSSSVLNSKESKFTLSILREDHLFDVTIKKKSIDLKSVDSKLIEEENKKIGYIYISIFANNTYLQFKEALSSLEKEQIDALIIDVRSNTGGHLTSVEQILDLFLGSKQILYQLQKNNKKTPVYGSGNENKNYNIVLLGDGGSASASEVLISSLKENLDAVFIGEKTYGKGTVQELVTLSDGNQYKITTKKWLTPKGNWINDSSGVIPTIEEKMNEEYYETYDEEFDNQLKKAIEFIKNN